MSKHFDVGKLGMLLDPERAEWTRPAELFAELEVGPGMQVADVGCGPGFFALPMAGLVGDEGRIFAIDDSPKMLEALAEGARARDLIGRIETREADAADTGLPDSSLDLVLCVFVYHEVDDREKLLAEFTRITRPGGTVAMVDWRKGVDSDLGPGNEERLTPQQMIDPMEAAGLAADELAFSPEYHVLIGRVPGEAAV